MTASGYELLRPRCKGAAERLLTRIRRRPVGAAVAGHNRTSHVYRDARRFAVTKPLEGEDRPLLPALSRRREPILTIREHHTVNL
jgi:hypothetical protein